MATTKRSPKRRRPTRAPVRYPYTIQPEKVVLTLSQFCGLYGLPIEVHMRDKQWAKENGIAPIYASIPGLEVVQKGILTGVSGNGRTYNEAIRNLINHISEKRVRLYGGGGFEGAIKYVDVPLLKNI